MLWINSTSPPTGLRHPVALGLFKLRELIEVQWLIIITSWNCGKSTANGICTVGYAVTYQLVEAWYTLFHTSQCSLTGQKIGSKYEINFVQNVQQVGKAGPGFT